MFDALKICSQTRCNKHKSYDQAALSEGTIDMKKSKQLHAGTMWAYDVQTDKYSVLFQNGRTVECEHEQV